MKSIPIKQRKTKGMHIVLPPLAIINCIIVYHLTKTAAIFKKTQDKNSTAMSSVAKTACKSNSLPREKTVSTQPRACINGLFASLAVKRLIWDLRHHLFL